eukprot:3064111-Ditylum_brightwellii.AAC.1
MVHLNDGENLYSKEGVTEGNPLAMILYALGVLPIIDHLEQYCQDAHTRDMLLFFLQIWYADNSVFA